MLYEHFRFWRYMCEYLNECWYKFSTQEGIVRNCKDIEQIYWLQHTSYLKSMLWNTYNISLITYERHPILHYKNDRATIREYRNTKGWRLCAYWEYKIDYLEQILLLGRNPSSIRRYWEEAIEVTKVLKVQREEERIKALKQVKMEQYEKGICFNCKNKVIPLMVDCVYCKQPYI